MMHRNSYEQMGGIAEKYLGGAGRLRVLDVGSMDVNGTYRPIFSRDGWEYVGVDISAGPNVDMVVDERGDWCGLADGSFDVVISGQALEHTEMPWLVAKAMFRVCRAGGWCVVVVPAVFKYHPFPKDCWRIWPDGLRALFVGNAGFVEEGCFTVDYEDGLPAVDSVFIGRKV